MDNNDRFWGQNKRAVCLSYRSYPGLFSNRDERRFAMFVALKYVYIIICCLPLKNI